jgi:hypothetical protein
MEFIILPDPKAVFAAVTFLEVGSVCGPRMGWEKRQTKKGEDE